MKRNKLSRLVKTASIALFSLSMTTLPPATQANDLMRLAQNLCEAAKSDDRSGMRKKLKSAKIRLRNIYSGISCGPQGSLLRVATSSGSMQAATFIATKIGKSNLAAAEADGKTVLQWAEELVASGDASKQAFVDLFKSKL
jgi:hypothetical protein